MKLAAKQQIKGNIGIVLVMNILISILAATGLGYIVVPAIYVSMCMAFIGLTRGRKMQIGDMFCCMDRFGRSLWLDIITGFFTFLWSMLFVIPGIIRGYAYSQARYIVADNPNMTARQALKESIRIMRGHKWEYFVLELSFIGWNLLTLLTFGLSAIYSSPYKAAAKANFYLNVKAMAGNAVEG